MVLFIDCDPGTDDVMALIYWLEHLDHEVVGVSSVFGNVDIEKSTRNLRMIAGYFNKTKHLQIKVFKGAAKPIIKSLGNDAAFVHGDDGCGQFFSTEYYNTHKDEINSMIDTQELSEMSAALGLVEMSKKYCGELSVVAIGPLTNVALAQLIDPEFGSRLKEVLIMGGELHGHGNSEFHPCAEFNFNKDPEAIYIALKELQCKKTILPLEPNFPITIKPEISDRWLKTLEKKNDLLSQVMIAVIKFRSKSTIVFKLYDLMLAIIMRHPTWITEMQTLKIAIELEGKYTRGKIVYDHYNKCSKHSAGEFSPVDVVTKLNCETIYKEMDEFIQSRIH